MANRKYALCSCLIFIPVKNRRVRYRFWDIPRSRSAESWRSIAALKFQLNNYAWRRALKRQNERALLTIKNKKGAATERKGRKEQQGSGRKRRNMSAVNNTLREIILRERPLTVTNNGSLSLFSSLLPALLLSLHTLCPRLHPFVAPCVAYTPPNPPSPFTPRFCESFTFPMHFSTTLHVHALEMRKRSWSIPALESMDVPEKKNQAVVIGTVSRLNWYGHLLRIYHDTNALCTSLRIPLHRWMKMQQLNYFSSINVIKQF